MFTTAEKEYNEAIHFLQIREKDIYTDVDLTNRNDILRAISSMDTYIKNYYYWEDVIIKLGKQPKYDCSKFAERLKFLHDELAKHKVPEIIKCPNCATKYDLNIYLKCPCCGKENKK